MEILFSVGTNLTNVLKKLVQKRIAATYNAPTVSLSISPGSTQEVGVNLNYILNPTFNQKDGGSNTNTVFKRSGVEIHTQSDMEDYTDSSRTVILGNLAYSVEVDYNQGPIKNDNFGDPDPSGQIPAGTAVKTTNVVGAYYNMHGIGVVSSGQDVRDNSTKTFSNTGTLNTGSVEKTFFIAVPSDKTLSSVIDLGNKDGDLAVNVTGDYVLSQTIVEVPDAAGTNVPYKVYINTNAVAYSSNHRHSFTIS